MSETETHETGIEKAQRRAREMREQGIEFERLDPLEKAKRSPTSLRLAINGKCFDCMGRGHDPNIK